MSPWDHWCQITCYSLSKCCINYPREHNRRNISLKRIFIFYHFIGQLYEGIKWPRKCPRSSLSWVSILAQCLVTMKISSIFYFRNLLNCTAMDIMYYTSPLFRMEIWSALQYELNRLYQMFTQRNPTFEANGGKVSIVSHSLGNSLLSLVLILLST